MIKTRLTAK